LDRRLATMPYAKLFLRCLPACPIISDPRELLQWWQLDESEPLRTA
jgi:hypothetical protein